MGKSTLTASAWLGCVGQVEEDPARENDGCRKNRLRSSMAAEQLCTCTSSQRIKGVKQL